MAKFVRRDTKSAIMREKKKLKEAQVKIFINDDITPLRGKMLRAVKKDPNVERAVTTSEGRITCFMKGQTGTRARKVTIENPDDLFKLGWTEEQLKESKLFLDI